MLTNLLLEYFYQHNSFKIQVVTNKKYNCFGIEYYLPIKNLVLSETSSLSNKLKKLNNFDLIIFDTEYSLLEFINLIEIKKVKPKKVALVHDEIWKKRPFILYRFGVYPFFKILSSTYGKINFDIIRSNSLSFKYRFNRFKLNIKGLLQNPINDLKEQYSEIDKISVLGKDTKRIWEKIFKRVGINARVISNPIILEPSLKPREIQRNNVFLIHSRIAQEKHIDFLIKAFKPFSKKGYSLIIAGRCFEPEYLSRLKRIVKILNLNNAVELKENLNEEELNSLFMRSKLYMCADSADFNLTTIKALNHNLPSITLNSFNLLSREYGFENKTLIRAPFRIHKYRKAIEHILEKHEFSNEAIDLCGIENYINKLLHD